MSGVFRGVLLGAGGALGVCSQTDSLNDIPRTLLTSALRGYDRISHNHNNLPSDNSNQTSQDLKALTQEIKNLKSGNDKQIVVYSGSSGTGTIVKIVMLTTTGVVVAYYFGYGFNDIMYVTKSTLSKAVKGLEEQLGFVGVKLEKTKDELLAMIAGVEESVFATSKDLQVQIDAETGKIRTQIGELDGKFARIESTQGKIQLSTKNLDDKIAILQEKFDKNGMELEKANSGIRLLVNSVVDLPHIKSNNGLVSDLRDFLGGYTNWFGGNNIEKEPVKKPAFPGIYGLQ